ncbi:MAG: methyltransferase domain-containing protein [Lentisphaerae bacterium]|nr:methyltransferase domain-containing protein [Lentisphaerota bacterium]
MFLKQALKQPRKIGAIAPSSRHLADMVMKTANLRGARTIVEIGPGTGVFTERIHAQMATDQVFFAIELNEHFFHEARRRCPGATIYHDSAANVGRYLKEHGSKHCDCVISSLPWGVFDEKLQDDIMAAVLQALRPGGEFLTYSYNILGPLYRGSYRYEKRLPGWFSKVRRTPIVWRNLPPAFVFHCIK